MSVSIPQNRFADNELNEWFSSRLGQILLAAENELIGEWAADLFGYQLLEISLFDSDLSYLDRCVIKNKIHIGPSLAPSRRQLEMRALPEQMPVATDYIDAVVLLHALEFAADPRQVLRECERMLIPEGRLIVCGFNPFSLWGVRRWLPTGGKRPPWKGKFISYARLQDWFSLLGFDVERTTTLMFKLPMQHRHWMGKMDKLESLGQKWLPWLGGVYVVQAVKRVSTVTPIRPQWQLERKLSKAAIEPGSTMRSGN